MDNHFFVVIGAKIYLHTPRARRFSSIYRDCSGTGFGRIRGTVDSHSFHAAQPRRWNTRLKLVKNNTSLYCFCRQGGLYTLSEVRLEVCGLFLYLNLRNWAFH